MNKSKRLRLMDLRKAYLLVGECCELGNDPKLWRMHLLDGLKRILGGDFAGWAIGSVLPNGAPGMMQELMDVGLEARETEWIRDQINADPIEHPAVRLAFPLKRRILTFRRPELVPDNEWYGSDYFNEVHAPAGTDDFIGCYLKVGPAEVEALSVGRACGDKLFAPREGGLFRVVAVEIARLMGSRLTSFHGPTVLNLPQRQRQVLLCLLEGDNEKQVAFRLGISKPTVHEHVKRLHRYFDVASRGELLARFVSDRTICSLCETLSDSGNETIGASE